VRLSAFIRDQNAAGIEPHLTSEFVAQVERIPLPRLRERAFRALVAMVGEVGNDVQQIHRFGPVLKIQAVSYSGNEDDLWFLICVLDQEGFVKLREHGYVNLTIQGILKAEELTSQRGARLQGFVAMSFDPSMDEVYAVGFYSGIRKAGYMPFRIDRKEHINGISDEILSEIRRSGFLVADYTHMNNGVYFEAGVAVGLGIPVIGTCRSDHLEKLHFDIKHVNTLKWVTSEQLADDLAKRIAGVIGDGPLRASNPNLDQL